MWQQPPLPPDRRGIPEPGWSSSPEPPAGATPAALRRGRLASWFVGLPFVVLAFFWLGLLVSVDSPASLGWLACMWISCLALAPVAIVGAVWAGQAGARGTMWWGVVAAVVCLPGFVMGIVALPSFVASLVR